MLYRVGYTRRTLDNIILKKGYVRATRRILFAVEAQSVIETQKAIPLEETHYKTWGENV